MRGIKYLIFCLFLCFIYSDFSFSQDLTGVWKGELIQVPNKKFYFEIRVETALPNGQIFGTTYIKKGVDYGTMRFTGQVNGDQITFTESVIIKEYMSSSNYYWCIKKGTLQLTQTEDELILEGDWTSPGCDPGSSIVSKKIEKSNQKKEDCLSDPYSAQFMQGIWTGKFDQYSCGLTTTFQLTLFIDEINGNKFTGTFLWNGYPNNTDSRSVLEGEFRNDSIFLYEPTQISGSPLILNGFYRAAIIDCNKLKGIWYLKELQPDCKDRQVLTDGGNYELEKFEFPTIYFDWSSSTLSKENRDKLDRMVQFLKDMPNIKIDISGHTDSTGSPAKNEILSKERAEIVKNYLVYKGIASSRLKAKGFGSSQFIGANKSEKDKERNRRVEIGILVK